MEKINKQKGEMDFLVMILLFILGIFVLWVLTGGSKNSVSKDKPFINPYNNNAEPLRVYGPNEKR